ncbi:unnamed protein product [Symbiodinium sp. CCMP2592]|nr:unnamed protein product [Symbiodinium sp. CCMP2592]
MVHRFRGLAQLPDPNGARMAWIQDIMLLDYDDFLKVEILQALLRYIQSQSLLRGVAMAALGRVVREDFPEAAYGKWVALLKAIAEQDRDDLALAARKHMAVYAPHLPLQEVQIVAGTIIKIGGRNDIISVTEEVSDVSRAAMSHDSHVAIHRHFYGRQSNTKSPILGNSGAGFNFFRVLTPDFTIARRQPVAGATNIQWERNRPAPVCSVSWAIAMFTWSGEVAYCVHFLLPSASADLLHHLRDSDTSGSSTGKRSNSAWFIDSSKKVFRTMIVPKHPGAAYLQYACQGREASAGCYGDYGRNWSCQGQYQDDSDNYSDNNGQGQYHDDSGNYSYNHGPGQAPQSQGQYQDYSGNYSYNKGPAQAPQSQDQDCGRAHQRLFFALRQEHGRGQAAPSQDQDYARAENLAEVRRMVVPKHPGQEQDRLPGVREPRVEDLTTVTEMARDMGLSEPVCRGVMGLLRFGRGGADPTIGLQARHQNPGQRLDAWMLARIHRDSRMLQDRAPASEAKAKALATASPPPLSKAKGKAQPKAADQDAGAFPKAPPAAKAESVPKSPPAKTESMPKPKPAEAESVPKPPPAKAPAEVDQVEPAEPEPVPKKKATFKAPPPDL